VARIRQDKTSSIGVFFIFKELFLRIRRLARVKACAEEEEASAHLVRLKTTLVTMVLKNALLVVCLALGHADSAVGIQSWSILKSQMAVVKQRTPVTMVLTHGFKMGANPTQIIINGNTSVTVIGNGVSLDMKSNGSYVCSSVSQTKARLFTLKGNAQLQLSNVTLSNGCQWATEDNAGGAIHLLNEARLMLSHCTFSRNHAYSGNGGAIYVGAGAHAIITDCVFQKNIAKKAGGAIYFDRGSSGVLKGCSFKGGSSPTVNDIARADTSDVIFECPDGSFGKPVEMNGTMLLQPPPSELKCSTTYMCNRVKLTCEVFEGHNGPFKTLEACHAACKK
jgi:predicted outer membrane repeat protein